MTDQEPTQEELKKFWKWCGLKTTIRTDDYEVSDFKVWVTPDGIDLHCLPALDLNNLFKYAVPKLGEAVTIQFIFGGTSWYCQIGKDGKWIADSGGYHKTPELALFRAIQGANR